MSLTSISEKLSQVSIEKLWDPYSVINWPHKLNPTDNWYFSPELISIYGSEEYNGMTKAEQKQLSFYEAINFFSLNIHGERSLLEGLAHQLNRPRDPLVSEYLHHFLDEENRHMILFSGFCNRYAGKIYAEKKIAFAREYAPGEEDFLFFAKVLIFEELVNFYNLTMAQDKRLEDSIREINRYHHVDEARHLVFGRELTKKLFNEYQNQWSSEVIANIRSYLENYIEMAWCEYYNPDVYRDAGLLDVYALSQRTFNSDDAKQHRYKASERCLKYFYQSGILVEENSHD